jgi:catechol 2,3-dioxygenase-like lactoylglutathione lyase family enzyme
MPMILNHTIVPSHDKESSARFFVRIFGLSEAAPNGPFAQVHVNDDLSFDWSTAEDFDSHHYAFLVNDQEFDEIFGRLTGEQVAYGSEPNAPANGEINTRRGGRGLYFADPDGHLMEIMTTPE